MKMDQRAWSHPSQVAICKYTQISLLCQILSSWYTICLTTLLEYAILQTVNKLSSPRTGAYSATPMRGHGVPLHRARHRGQQKNGGEAPA